MFEKSTINYIGDPFSELSLGVVFEQLGRDRKGATLVSTSTPYTPLVRSTTRTHVPSQLLTPAHKRLLQLIVENGLAVENYNNALIEIYGNGYTSMNYHSDCGLDLRFDSWICLYTCYSDPKTSQLRRLHVRNKHTNETSIYELHHNSIVAFRSDSDNKHYVHKIVGKSDVEWMGVTFRCSRTFIYFVNEIPYFAHYHQELRMATQNEETEFYNERRQENFTNFVYTGCKFFTTSIGDLKQPSLT